MPVLTPLLYHLHYLLPPLKSHAYLDPGSGSFLIQLLIAGLVGAAFIIKGYWGKIKALFTRSSRQPKDDSQPKP